MEQNIESKVEAPVAVHAPHAAQAKEAKAPVANAKVVKKDFAPKTAEVPTAPVAESKPIIVRKKSQFSDYKLFNKWSFADVIISDLSLNNYVNLDPVIMPHTFGRKTRGRFEKANLNIVERLVNKIMRSGQGKRKLSGKFIRGRGSCGKKMEAMKIVESAFEIIEKQTKQNQYKFTLKQLKTQHQEKM